MEPMALNIGQTVKQMIENDLALEINAVAMYNKAVAVARAENDNGSRELLEKLAMDEEEHVDWLEAQVHQMKEMGYERYLIMQVGEDD
jgi:bacterioferritin